MSIITLPATSWRQLAPSTVVMGKFGQGKTFNPIFFAESIGITLQARKVPELFERERQSVRCHWCIPDAWKTGLRLCSLGSRCSLLPLLRYGQRRTALEVELTWEGALRGDGFTRPNLEYKLTLPTVPLVLRVTVASHSQLSLVSAVVTPASACCQELLRGEYEDPWARSGKYTLTCNGCGQENAVAYSAAREGVVVSSTGHASAMSEAALEWLWMLDPLEAILLAPEVEQTCRGALEPLFERLLLARGDELMLQELEARLRSYELPTPSEKWALTCPKKFPERLWEQAFSGRVDSYPTPGGHHGHRHHR